MKFIEFNQICLGDGDPKNHFPVGKVALDKDNVTTLFQVTDKNNKLIPNVTVIRDRHGISFALSHPFDEVKEILETAEF